MGMMEEHFTVLVDGVERPVTVTYKRIRNIYLRVDADGSLKVSCPRYVGLAAVRRFIAERAHWIGRTEVKARASEAQNRNGVTGPILWWMGEKKYARYEEAARSRMTLEGDVATFYLKEQNDAAIEKAFDAAARRQLAAMIEEYRPQWDALICDQHSLPHPAISMRRMKSRWGVCTPVRSKIVMNTQLVHYPKECTQYVLLHEYAHLLEANHSKRFYAIIESYMPEYKIYRKLLG